MGQSSSTRLARSVARFAWLLFLLPGVLFSRLPLDAQPSSLRGVDRFPKGLRFHIDSSSLGDRFYVLAGIALCLAGAGILFWRNREAKHQRRLLEEEVSRRTAELTREKLHAVAQNRQIEALLEKAVEASRLKSEFLANISHEIRTPMNAILGMIHLAKDCEQAGERSDYLKTASTAASRLLTLLNDLLDYSQIEAGKLQLAPLEFSLREQVEAVVTAFSGPAAEKGLTLHWEVEKDVPDRLLGDEVRLRQILSNLVDNAVKFTLQGGVAIRVAVDSLSAGACLRFSVIDTGVGIPPEMREAIFQPFRQGDGSATRRYGGNGLGLAICTRLAGAMNGKISVTSAQGRGSRFEFTACFSQCSVPAASGPKERSPDSMRPLRVLVVEDNAVNRRLVAKVLERRGHSVLTAVNGLEALVALETNSVDVVLMDLQMPYMDGLEATRQWRGRENGGGRRLPVVAFTANATSDDRDACSSAGMDAYLSKPIDPHALIEMVERLGTGPSSTAIR